jgi:hypothetical protein
MNNYTNADLFNSFNFFLNDKLIEMIKNNQHYNLNFSINNKICRMAMFPCINSDTDITFRMINGGFDFFLTISKNKITYSTIIVINLKKEIKNNSELLDKESKYLFDFFEDLNNESKAFLIKNKLEKF